MPSPHHASHSSSITFGGRLPAPRDGSSRLSIGSKNRIGARMSPAVQADHLLRRRLGGGDERTRSRPSKIRYATIVATWSQSPHRT